MSTVATFKARCQEDRMRAMLTVAERLRPVLGVPFRLSEISRSALDAVGAQWGRSEFDWDEIHRVYRDPDALKLAIWIDTRLCGMAVATTTGQKIILRFIEGSPDPSCPLKGVRALIAIEAATTYGQRRGKTAIDLEPLNEELISLYENSYGFDTIRPPKGPPKCTKRI